MPAELRSRFWGFLSASLSVGTICAYANAPSLIEERGWPSVFYVYGGVGAALALVWARVAVFKEPASGAEDAVAAETNDLDDFDLRQMLTSRTVPAVSLFFGELSLSLSRRRKKPRLRRETRARDSSRGARSERAVRSLRPEASTRPFLLTTFLRGVGPVWALALAHSSSNFFLYFALAFLPLYFSYQFGESTSSSAANHTPRKALVRLWSPLSLSLSLSLSFSL